MPHDVFISYSSKDKPIADAICANLEKALIRCWIAPRDIQPGDDWPTAITEAIAESRIMVLVFSANSNASADVGREIMLAANSKLVIIPFKIEDVEPVPGKKYYLARTHWLDAINPPTQEQIDLLVSRVTAFLSVNPNALQIDQEPTQDGLHPAKSEPKSTLKARTARKIWVPTASIFTVALILWLILTFITKTLPPPAIFLPNNTETATTRPPTATSTAVIPINTTAPVLMATPTEPIVQATEPEPTETSQPGWVTSFSNPILGHINNRPPTLQDNFESSSIDLWALFGSWNEDSDQPMIENGQFYVANWETYLRGFQFDDYVLKVDARFDPTSLPGWLGIEFRNRNCRFSLSRGDYAEAWCVENPGGEARVGNLRLEIENVSGGRTIPLILIVKDTRFAFYVDGEPLGFIDHDYLEIGNGMLVAESPYAIFDNYQVWDISDYYVP